MANPVIKQAIGTVDGINTTFQTQVPYQTGSVRAFVNGLVRVQGDEDGWTEGGGSTIELTEAPKTGDRVSFYYIPA